MREFGESHSLVFSLCTKLLLDCYFTYFQSDEYGMLNRIVVLLFLLLVVRLVRLTSQPLLTFVV